MATAQDVILRASNLLQDLAGLRWTPAEMLLWVTDAQRAATTIKPNLFTKTVIRTLTAGATQSLTDLTDYVTLVGVNRNIGNDNVTPGRMVVVIDPALMDATDPLWQTATPASTIAHYMFVLDRRFEYRVQPPAVAGTKVEITYAARPPVLTASTDDLVLQDHCVPALVDYVCYRAASKDADFAPGLERAAMHLKAFTETVPTL